MRKFLVVIMLIMAPVISWACDAGYGLNNSGECVVCPADLGYSVNAAGECVTQCAAGSYVAIAGQACKQIIGDGYESYYVDTAHTVKYGDTSLHMLKECPRDRNGNKGFIPAVLATGVNWCIQFTIYNIRFTADDRGDCRSNGLYSCYYETHGTAAAPCYYTTGDDGNAIYDKQTRDPVTGESRNGCVGDCLLTSCDAGWYASPMRSWTAPQFHPCSPVGTGYYSPGGDVERYPCPEKTATCGYGDCAKSIDDCKPYKTIMTSTGVSLMMQPEQRTHPALGLRMPDDGSVWYGQADPGARDGHLNIEYDEKPYALINPMDLFIELPNGEVVPEKPTLPHL